MLGDKNGPSLLVDVDDNYNPTNFKFYVVNGAWDGICVNNIAKVADYFESETEHPVTIICDNQDRLRGDYNDVFNNFNNPDYVAPKPEKYPAYWDDDIPF
jgi:hypothetical protein